MNFVPGSGELKPDIAQRCDFTAPTTYTCKLKPNLKFANGHALTSSDVKFSIDRENDDQRSQRTAVAAGQPRQRRNAGSVDGGLQAEAAQRPDLPPGARHQRRTDHRRRGVPVRQGARRQRHRRRRTVRGSLHDDDLLQESAHRPARQPRVSGAVRQAEDRTGRHQVLRQHRQPQDRHREPGHRRRVAQPVAHRHRGPAAKPQPRRSRGSRRGTALHRVQHEHHARRHPRAEAGDPQGDRLVARPRRAGP